MSHTTARLTKRIASVLARNGKPVVLHGNPTDTGKIVSVRATRTPAGFACQVERPDGDRTWITPCDITPAVATVTA